VAVPPDDAPALARAIVATLRDPARRQRIGRAAQRWARAHDASWTARQFEQLYAASSEAPLSSADYADYADYADDADDADVRSQIDRKSAQSASSADKTAR